MPMRNFYNCFSHKTTVRMVYSRTNSDYQTIFVEFEIYENKEHSTWFDKVYDIYASVKYPQQELYTWSGTINQEQKVKDFIDSLIDEIYKI